MKAQREGRTVGGPHRDGMLNEQSGGGGSRSGVVINLRARSSRGSSMRLSLEARRVLGRLSKMSSVSAKPSGASEARGRRR